jgi:hypothetical protein
MDTIFVTDTIYRFIQDTSIIHSIDIVDRIDSIYNRSFNLIIMTFAIFAGLTGIIIPLLIAYWQNRSLKLKEDEIANKVKDTENKLNSQIEFKTNHLKATISSFENRFENLYEQYFKLQENMVCSSKLTDIKIKISSDDFLSGFCDICRFLNDDVTKSNDIYSNYVRREALFRLRLFDIKKIMDLSNTPNDMGHIYSLLLSSEGSLKGLIDKDLLEEEDSKYISEILKIVFDKRMEFPLDQKGIHQIFEARFSNSDIK